MEPEDEEGLCAPEEPVVKKRGKKKKKVVEENFLPLPEEVKTGYSPEIIEELQSAYNILQYIMGIPKIRPFLERPNENLFGMSAYYNIIKKPMWLLEVKRKLLNREYEDIAGFVADIRLILENCYRFWGPCHKFCRKALLIEHKLEIKLSQLPEAMQEKFFDPQLANEVVVKTERADDELVAEQPPKEEDTTSVTVPPKKGFKSKILSRVLDDEPQDDEDIEEQNRKEAEMLYWEREHLVNDVHKEQIKAMWQLAEIGSFLKLTFEALNVEEITQYEVERMLLMPKESTTLATLMTSMLSPQVMRSQLDDKPVMPYSIWTSRLKKRIDYWLGVFYTAGDELEAFTTCGVEPAFWTSVHLKNPLENNGFHEIPFYQRVWIFKSLCNHLMHSDKPIQDILLDKDNTRDLRPIRIAGDKIGNIYFRIPFFREIRVYKQARLPHKAFQNDNDDFLSNLMEATSKIETNEENELEFLPTKNDCFMIADSIESLAEFTQKLKEKKRLVLAKHFSKQLTLVKNERKSIEGLIALYTQWHEYQNRSQEYFDHILHLWRSTEKQPQVFDSVDPQNITTENVVLGRRRKRNPKYDFLSLKGTDDSSEQSSDFESSDVSDWESTYRHKKKKKLEKKKITKRASSEPRSETSDDFTKQDYSNHCSTISIQEVLTLKEEYEEDIKPDIDVLNSQSENGNVIFYDKENSVHPESVRLPITNSVRLNSNNSPSSLSPCISPASTPSVPLDSVNVSVPAIKKEKDDVIYISSDEEKESGKPLHSQRNKVNNGIPAPKVLPGVQVPIRTPSPNPSVLARTRNVPQPKPAQQSIPHVPKPIPVAQSIPQSQMPLPVPQPIPLPQMPQHITVTPRSSTMPMPIPAPAPARQMPLPIPEPPMPQPIVEPPMPQPIASPQASRGAGWNSPKSVMSSPRVRGLSPRIRSPLSSPSVRTPSPRGAPSPLRSALSPIRPVRNAAVRNLFPQTPAVPTVEGVLEIGQKPDGSYGYHVRLPDGGIINMSRLEIDDIRRKNNGVLPVKIEVPLTKNKKF